MVSYSAKYSTQRHLILQVIQRADTYERTSSFLSMSHRDTICEERQHRKTLLVIIAAPKGADLPEHPRCQQTKTLVKDLMPTSQKEIRYFKKTSKNLSIRSGRGQLETFVKKKKIVKFTE